MMTGIPECSTSGPRVYGYTSSENKRRARADGKIRAQRLALLVWASDQGTEITEFVAEYEFDPGVPVQERTEAERLIARLKRGDTIVVTKFDRLFGAPEDAPATLRKARERGVHFRAVDVGNGASNLEMSQALDAVLLAVAAAYSDYPKRLAVRRVKKREAEAGRFLGGKKPTFGFDAAPDGRLFPNQEQQENIAHLLEMRRAGRTYNELAAISAQRGFDLTAPGIHKILKRAASSPVDQN